MKKLIIEFWRCEMDRSVEIRCTDESLRLLVEALNAAGIETELREIKKPFFEYDDPGRHRMRAVLHAVHEVQGKRWEEGTTWIPAVEGLVAKYAEIK